MRLTDDYAALAFLSAAKARALCEVIQRASSAAAGKFDPECTTYDAMEAWRTAANAYDYVHRAIRLQLLGGVS